ncbi:MAG: hypothetical protein IKS61_02845 [Aeriscardovia sp.]|nr:hypothetical protein [Aeriscardovia sp.]
MKDRHDRGSAGAFGGAVPYYRTKNGRFERLASFQMRRLWRKDERFARMVEVQIREFPPSCALETGEGVYSALEEGAGTGGKDVIILYSRTLEENCGGGESLSDAIGEEMVVRLAEIFGERPEDIDPDFGLDS